MQVAAPAPPCMPMYSANNTTHPDYRTSCVPTMQQQQQPPNMLPPAQPPMDPMPYVFTAPHPQPPPPSPPKRDWNEVNAGCVRDEDEIAHKKCINCRLSEIRYHQTKAKLESVEASTQIIKDNIALLDQKKAKLMAILAMVLFKDMPN